MNWTNMLPVLGLLVLAVAVVVLLLRMMRRPHASHARPAPAAKVSPPAAAPLSKEDQEYLDSSHILPAGRDPLDTLADDWRKGKKNK